MTQSSNSNRREILGLAGATAAALAVPGLSAQAAAPASRANGSALRAREIFKPPFRFGLGGVPLGNEFAVVTDEDAQDTLDAAWKAGTRYFDTSPWYGLGLAERRFGQFLHGQDRDSFLISTKVGKLLKASPKNDAASLFPYGTSPNNVVFDYTADGVRRSIEDSLQRMGLDRIDVVFVHDISADNALLPTPWPEQFAIALKGAFPALSKMREEGLIRGWGIGVNTPEPILRVMRESDPDVCLLASQYSLIDHANALNNVFPVAREKGVGFVVGSSLNAGFISGSPRYNYGKTSWNIAPAHLAKRERLRAVAGQFGVDLRTAALQFSAAPDLALSLIVGAHTEAQALANATSMKATVPPEFWAELKKQGLIEQNAPVPGAA
ncbi:aldo/keto reductase [Methylobacterium sp. C25]|uniref:aldo/keto reductase n=1 Tax=Methylobacterium sp. C25 TaxID=2721622 RepID=UPI001F370514|nr:aldo/keto reductase [Methylobacterium sp. C25]MCE4222935.1 aldo/keto reductase [Methylobacterium sp. C25]